MYVGLDFHKMYSEAAVVEEEDTVVDGERIENELGNIEKFSNSLPAGTDVVIESSSTWFWVYSILRKRHNVVLGNSAKTKAVASAKIKTDRLDALKLANLLRGGYIAESDKPPNPSNKFLSADTRTTFLVNFLLSITKLLTCSKSAN